jgi:hypothetical protein
LSWEVVMRHFYGHDVPCMLHVPRVDHHCSITWNYRAVPWLRRLVAGLSTRRFGFSPRSIQWDLWWTKWLWDWFISKFFRFSPVNIIPPWAPHFRKLKKNSSFIHPFTHPDPGMDKRPVKAAAVQWDVSLTPITRIQDTELYRTHHEATWSLYLLGHQKRLGSFKCLYLLIYCTNINEFCVIEHVKFGSLLFK